LSIANTQYLAQSVYCLYSFAFFDTFYQRSALALFSHSHPDIFSSHNPTIASDIIRLSNARSGNIVTVPEIQQKSSATSTNNLKPQVDKSCDSGDCACKSSSSVEKSKSDSCCGGISTATSGCCQADNDKECCKSGDTKQSTADSSSSSTSAEYKSSSDWFSSCIDTTKSISVPLSDMVEAIKLKPNQEKLLQRMDTSSIQQRLAQMTVSDASPPSNPSSSTISSRNGSNQSSSTSTQQRVGSRPPQNSIEAAQLAAMDW
jgi:hypothetical protein